MKLTDDQLARVRMSGHIPYGLLDHIDSLTVENERLKGERKMTDEELSDMRQWNIDCGATTWSIKFGKLLDHIDSLTERLKEAMRAAPDCKIHPGELTLKCRVCVGEDTAIVTDVWREEVDRLKQPMDCGHPAACLFRRLEAPSVKPPSGGLVSVECCSACASERAAVEKEREACADIAEWRDAACGKNCSVLIMSAIRARKP